MNLVGHVAVEYPIPSPRSNAFYMDASTVTRETRSVRVGTSLPEDETARDAVIALFEATDPEDLAWGENKEVIWDSDEEEAILIDDFLPAFSFNMISPDYPGDPTAEYNVKKCQLRWRIPLDPVWRSIDGAGIHVKFTKQVTSWTWAPVGGATLPPTNWDFVSEALTDEVLEAIVSVGESEAVTPSVDLISGANEMTDLLPARVPANIIVNGFNDWALDLRPPAAGFAGAHQFRNFYAEHRAGSSPIDLTITFSNFSTDGIPMIVDWKKRTINLSDGSLVSETDESSEVPDGGFESVLITAGTGTRVYASQFTTATLAPKTLPTLVPIQDCRD